MKLSIGHFIVHSTHIPSQDNQWSLPLYCKRERMSLNQYLYICEPYDLETEKLFGLHLDFAKTELSNLIFFLRKHIKNCWNLYWLL